MKQTIYQLNVLWQDKVVDVDADKLLEAIEAGENSFTTDIDSTRHEDTKLEWNSELEKIKQAAIDLIIEDGMTNDKIEYVVPDDEFWAHVQEKNMSTNTHDHGHAALSVVYWLKVPEGSGNLRLHLKPEQIGTPVIEPKEGGMIIFPAWLEHSVGRNRSEENRISISMNLFARFVQPQEEPAIDPEVV